MNVPHLPIRLAAAGAGLALVVVATPAMADTTPSPSPASNTRTCAAERLSFIKARVDAAVQARELTLQRLTSRLAARVHVTDDHRSTLTATYTADASGLRIVDATVQSDTTCAQAVTDGRTVVTNYRVYLLVVPQTHLVAAADTGMWAAGQLAAAEPKAQTAIDALTDPTKKAAAQALLNDMKAQIGRVNSALTGVADAVLALKPSDIPAQLNTIEGFRTEVATAHADLATALSDARQLRAMLSPAPAATPGTGGATG